MDARLAAPPLTMGSESPEQSLSVLNVARDIVIPQNDHLARERAVLFCDGLHPSLAHTALIHDRDRAEIAIVRAAARGKQDSTRMIAPVKQVFPRHRGVFQTWGFSGTVPLAMAPRFKFAQELGPVGFGPADEDHIRMP